MFNIFKIILIVILFSNQLSAKIPNNMISFSRIVKEISPAVVNVYSKKKVKVNNFLFGDEIFKQFFGHDIFRNFNQEKIQQSLGSGVIISRNGRVITNAHVVGDSEEITIVMADKREFDAKIILTDKKNDLALLEIIDNDEKFPYAKLSDSDNIEIGDIVLAIGNPFGIGQSVTSGIISALSRSSNQLSNSQMFIQTDAAINPGNSGGALINLKGEVIGINTAIFSKSGGSHGIGFAIPSNTVKVFFKNVNSKGEVIRPWLGIDVQDLSKEFRESMYMNKNFQGVLISNIHKLSPFYGQVRIGGIIRSINGNHVKNVSEFKARVANLEIGKNVSIKYLIEGDIMAYSVKKTISAPDYYNNKAVFIDSNDNLISGLTIARLSPLYSSKFNINESAEGIVIVDVKDATIASNIGFKKGDVIIKINNKIMKSVKTIKNITNDKSLNKWKIEFIRDKKTFSSTIRR